MIKYANGIEDIFSPPPVPSVVVVTDKKEEIPFRDNPLKFSGPRIGFTVIGRGEAADKIRALGKTPFVTQFGWQFETRVFTMKNGTSGLVELVPLISGIEQGMILPSFNALFGIQGKKGTEFALGPNASLTGAGLALAVGTSLHSENVYFPINFAIVLSVTRIENKYNSNTNTSRDVDVHTGLRFSVLVGFNMRKL